MSKSALLFVLASLACFMGAMLLPLGSSALSAILGYACAAFAVMFVLALVKGRRIKFDPLLR